MALLLGVVLRGTVTAVVADVVAEENCPVEGALYEPAGDETGFIQSRRDAQGGSEHAAENNYEHHASQASDYLKELVQAGSGCLFRTERALGQAWRGVWSGARLSTACHEPPLVIASFFAATVSEFAFASLGFGTAVLYQISWQVCTVLGLSGGDLEQAVGNIMIMGIPCGIVQMVRLRRNFRPKLTVLWNLPCVVMVPIGTTLLRHYGKSDWILRALGALLMVVVGLQVYRRRLAASAVSGTEQPTPRLDEEPRAPSTLGAMWAAIALSGFSCGLFGVAGPPLMVLLMHYSFSEPDTWRCISATNRFVMDIMINALLAPDSDVKGCWPMYVALMAGGLVGLGLGNLAAPYIDARAFQRWLILFLAAGAALLMCTGFKTASTVAALIVGLIFLVVASLPAAAFAESLMQGKA